MPDRYGDDDHNGEHPHPEPQHRTRDAIDACQLCDTHGRRNGFPCDHHDHAEAAKRGMALIREAMGWT